MGNNHKDVSPAIIDQRLFTGVPTPRHPFSFHGFQSQRAARLEGARKRPQRDRHCRAFGNGSVDHRPAYALCRPEGRAAESISTTRLHFSDSPGPTQRRQVRARSAQSSHVRVPLLPKHGRPGHGRPGRCSFSSASGRFGQKSHYRRFQPRGGPA